MKYRIIESDSATDLEAAVTHAMGRGWQVQGGVCVTRVDLHCEEYKGFKENTRSVYAQAMIWTNTAFTP